MQESSCRTNDGTNFIKLLISSSRLARDKNIVVCFGVDLVVDFVVDNSVDVVVDIVEDIFVDCS